MKSFIEEERKHLMIKPEYLSEIFLLMRIQKFKVKQDISESTIIDLQDDPQVCLCAIQGWAIPGSAVCTPILYQILYWTKTAEQFQYTIPILY